MIVKALSYGYLGMETYPVEIEVSITGGLPAINIVGLADTAIKEARVRVKSAIVNSGYDWPVGKITINLAPSHIKKEGPGFDTAIALAVLAASEQIDPRILDGYCILGELSLTGNIRHCNGVLLIALALARTDISRLLVPEQNAAEAGLVPEIQTWAIRSLRQAIEIAGNPDGHIPAGAALPNPCALPARTNTDFADIKGQWAAKRAIEVAVAGGHNIVMIGPPGGGKTMLAKRIPSILPHLTLSQALEITKIHSIVGLVPHQTGIVATHPFRDPHHTISYTALVGGGSIPKPGEISLAHNGILFLDELPEFPRNCLEALRQPLEDGTIIITRAQHANRFPCRFMLVCALNPCPCGHFMDTRRKCRCTPVKIQNYLTKISGPLLDRIDIHIEVPAVQYKELSDTTQSETSDIIRARIEHCRQIQETRLGSDGLTTNAGMNQKQIRKYCVLSAGAETLLKNAMNELGLSARAYSRILKVSRTIADMEEKETIDGKHIAEAIQYRSLDRRYL
jgi:magnesium chelatase family protein